MQKSVDSSVHYTLLQRLCVEKSRKKERKNEKERGELGGRGEREKCWKEKREELALGLKLF